MMTKKTDTKKSKKKKPGTAMPKPSGMAANEPKITSTDLPAVTVEMPPKDPAEPVSLPLIQAHDANLRIREEDGAIYARVTKMCQNKRLVIVSPFNKEFPPGRMAIPARGAGNKLAKRNRKLWVIPVRSGVYKCAGIASRYG